MALRITQNSMNRTQLAGLNNSLSRLQQTQEQLTSGKRLNRPSDSPVDTASAMRLRGEQRQLEQFGVAITDGLSRLGTADDALASASKMMQRMRQITVAAANGTNGSDQLAAYAKEARQLKDGLIQLANTEYAGRPIFAGTANVTQAFAADGTYQGNTSPVLRAVSSAPGAAGQMNVAIPGSEAFGDLLKPGGAIDTAITAMEAGTAGSALDGLDTGMSALTAAGATIGARTNRLTGLQELNGRQDDASKVALSKVEDVDFIKAAMDLNIQSNAYNAALQASAKIIQPSLMDFLR